MVRLRAEETSDATRDPVVELPGQQFGDGGEDGFDDADTVLAGSPPSTPEATGLEPAPSTVRARGSSSEGADDDEAAYSESFDSEEEAPSPTHDAGAGAGTGASPAPVGPVPHGAGGARPTAATTAELLARVQRLPTGQQRVLLGVLSQLEAGEERPEVVESAETEALVRASVGNPESWGQIVACLGQGGPTEEEEEGEGDTAVAPPSSEPAPAPAAREEVAVGGAHWLLVRLLGPHNGGTVVGLTGLEVVARSTGGRHQPVTGLDVRLCWLSDAEAAALEGRASASLSCLPTPAPTSPTDSLTPQRAAQRLQCLVDGVTRTREEGHMWKCPLEGAGCVGRPALLLRLPPDCGRPVELRVWNYNRSLHLLSLGVGDCEVWVDGARAWQGRLRRGCGNAKFEYAESVPLVDGGGEVEEEGEREGEEVAETGAEEAVGVGEGRGASDEGDEGTARGLDVGSGVGGEESTTRAVQSEQSGRRAEGTAVAPGASPQEQVDTAGDAPVITGASTTGEAAPRPSSPGEGGDAVHPRGGDAPVPLAASPSQAAAAAASTPSPARRSRDAPSSGGGGSATQELRRSLAEESLLAASQVGSPALLSPPRAATRKLAGRRAQLLAVRREQMMSEQQEVREVREAREKERERRLAVADSLLQQALEGYSEAAGRSTSPPPNDGSGDGGVAGGGGDGGIQAVPRAGRRSRRGRPDPPPADDDASTTAPAEAPPPRAAASGLEPGQARFGRRASVEDRLPSRRPRGGGGAEEGEGEGAEGPVQREAGRADEPALPTEAPLSAVERPASPDASALELSGTLVEIPELPAGETMQVSVASTWGDPRYVGLAGIDVFDDSGAPVRLGPGAVRATPRGVCDLPGHSGDPRTADKLCDGVNFTCDARHMWLAPFYPERGARITLRLPRRVRVAMIRVWNYNKSRVASERGARAVTITLDGSPVFSGEVRRAPGTLAEGPDACSEVILCTLDAAVLARIEAHDEECLVADRDGTTEAVAALLSEQEAARPSTAARPGRGARATLRGARAVTRKGQQPDVLVRRRRHQRGEGEEAVEATAAADERPPTALHVSAGAPAASSRGDWVRAEEEEEMERSSAQDPVLAPPPRASRSTGLRVSPQPASASSATALVEGKEGKEEDKQWALDDDDIARILAEAEMSDSDVDSPHGGGGDSGVHASLQGEEQPTGVSPNAAGGAAGDDLAWLLQRGPLLEGREVELEVLSTWGDPFYAGLTGVELLVVGEGGEVVPEPNARVDATPRDLNVGGHSGDPRVLGNLLNGDNCTVDERSMWLVAQPQGGHAAPRVSCPRPRHLAGLRVWNYNKSVEDAERGVRSARCRVDGVDCGVRLVGVLWALCAPTLFPPLSHSRALPSSPALPGPPLSARAWRRLGGLRPSAVPGADPCAGAAPKRLQRGPRGHRVVAERGRVRRARRRVWLRVHAGAALHVGRRVLCRALRPPAAGAQRTGPARVAGTGQGVAGLRQRPP